MNAIVSAGHFRGGTEDTNKRGDGRAERRPTCSRIRMAIRPSTPSTTTPRHLAEARPLPWPDLSCPGDAGSISRF